MAQQTLYILLVVFQYPRSHTAYSGGQESQFVVANFASNFEANYLFQPDDSTPA
jgi:hypothetical protein